MNTQTADQWKQFQELVRKTASYFEAIAVLHWDLRTGAPRKSVESRSETIGMLTTEAFRLQTSQEMGRYLDYFAQPEVQEQLDEIERRIVAECRKEYDRNKSIPPEKIKEYSVLAAQSESEWEQAKKNNDFAGFEPYLSRIVAFKQEFIDYWGVKGTRYDTLLDMYEPDLTVEKLDQVFDRLRKRLVPLVQAVSESQNKPDTSFLKGLFDKEQQKKMSLFMLKQMGYDFEGGRLDESEHPFMTGLNLGDIRVTTKYLQDDVASAVFSSLHEGGHALYEQNIDKKLEGTPLARGASMGIHESQSRLWENMIGRSRPFWRRYFKDLQQHFPEQFANVDAEQFYLAVNKVENSLIRIEADELTYNLHVIIRYEIEKMLFNEGLAVKDLPEVWNAKYKEYLGVMPPNDSMGVLQDIHWSGGDFGYFASYSLGNMYAAQFIHAMRKDMPDLDSLIEQGNLAPIKEWLTDKIHKYGQSQTPAEIILRVTGEELNPDYLADYLEEKFKEIYKL